MKFSVAFCMDLLDPRRPLSIDVLRLSNNFNKNYLHCWFYVTWQSYHVRPPSRKTNIILRLYSAVIGIINLYLWISYLSLTSTMVWLKI